MRGPLEPGADHAAQSSREIEALVIESRFGRGDVALRQVESMLPAFEQRDDSTMLLHALYARALIVRRLGSPAEDILDACDVLEDSARSRGFALWAAVACALRAQSRVDEGDVVAATADLARADIDLSPVDLASPVAFRLLDALAVVYARLRLHDRLDDVRERIESTVESRSPLERAIHWAGWCSELAVRAMEPVAMGEGEPATPSLRSAVEIGARIDSLPPAAVPPPLRRGVSAVRALAAAYRGRPSEALRVLGQDAFGEARQLPPVERQIATLAAMRAHAHVGSIASARSLDDAAGQTKSTLVHLVLSVCRARERLWLETHAGGQVVPVLNRLVDLLVRLGWHGMDLVADIARQSMEHHALREESRTDALTGVGNRRALDEELRQLVRFSQLPLSLVLIDVDDFKGVNDRFTHVVGDDVLRQVASSLSEQLRGGDRLLRFGGDEFVALLPATGDQEAHRVAARMSRAIETVDWSELAAGLEVTATTGSAALWSLTERRPDADAERLFQRADEALLSAKRRRAATSGTRVVARTGAGSRSASGRVPGGRPELEPVFGAGVDLRLPAAVAEPTPGTGAWSDAGPDAVNLLQESRSAPSPAAPRVPAPSAPSTPISMPMPAASLFNEPTSFVQPAPASPATLPTGSPAANGHPANGYPANGYPQSGLTEYAPQGTDTRSFAPSPVRGLPSYGESPQAWESPKAWESPRAWEPGWQPEWAASAAPRDPLTDPLTGPLLEPLLDPLLDRGSGRHRPASDEREPTRRAIAAEPHHGSDFVDPQTDALEVIDLTSGLARRRREGGPDRAPQLEERAPNGLPPIGFPPNGLPPNGLPPIGFPPNALPPKDFPANGLPPIGFPPVTSGTNGSGTKGSDTNGSGTNGSSRNGSSPDAAQQGTYASNGLPPIGFSRSTTVEREEPANGQPANGVPFNGLPPIGFPSNGSPSAPSGDSRARSEAQYPAQRDPAGQYRPRARQDEPLSTSDGPYPHGENAPTPLIDLTGHGRRRHRERLRPDDSDEPR